MWVFVFGFDGFACFIWISGSSFWLGLRCSLEVRFLVGWYNIVFSLACLVQIFVGVWCSRLVVVYGGAVGCGWV